MNLHIANFSAHPLDVNLIRSERKTLAISVYPDQSVEAISPRNATKEEITAKILKRRHWILRQQKYFRQLASQESPEQSQLLLSGAEVHYLGRQYRLKIETHETRKKASLRGRYLHVPVKDPDTPESVRVGLADWYRGRADDYLPKRLEKVRTQFSHLRLPEPKLRIRMMKSRWGSCTASGTITLNPLLILAPSHLIDYVIVHELCHLQHPNHGKEFYRLLESTLPNWQNRKEKLDQFGVNLKENASLFSSEESPES